MFRQEYVVALDSFVDGHGVTTVTSGVKLTIENVAGFLQIVRESLKTSDSVAITFEPSLEIDITGVQILCSACKSAALGGKVLSYYGPQPQGLADIIKSSGAARYTACRHNNDSLCAWFGGSES